MSIAPTASLLPPLSASPSPHATSAPKPSPTLNWDAVGFQASVKDPVSIGSKAKVILKGPVGPTCKLKIQYASGVNATVPSPTHPKSGWWQWTWTIPSKAKAGTASGTATCTYAGVPHTGDVSFKIVDPALPGGWAIDATLPSTRSSTDASPVHVVIHVRGTVPEDPAYDNRMICEVNIVGQGSDVVSDIPYHNGDGQFAIDAEIAALGSDAIGTQTWTVACRNEMVAHSTLKSDTGHITIT